MRTLGLATILITLCLALPALATVTTYTVYRPAVSPVVDGDVTDDPAWRMIPEATGFHVLGGGYTQAKQSATWLCWDAGAIYVALVAEEPDAAELKPSARDGGATWTEDSMEVFLQPRPPTGQTYQFGVTAGGAKGAGEGFPDLRQVQAAARIGETSYSLELRVPWAVVDVRPQAGDKWRGTVCRNIWTTTSGGDKFTSLSPLQSRFLEPENFATLIFSAATPDAAAAAKATQALNQDYRETLRKELRDLVATGEQYEDDLRSAVTDEVYGQQARELLRGWRRLARLNRRADEIALAEIRAGLAGSTNLERDSYEIKYRILLRRLLLD
jgi:hypothetical protein